jgi:hypothetical protein
VSIPAALARLASDPFCSKETSRTERAGLSRFNAAARLIGDMSSQETTHASVA